jgi:hypothetical protein
MESFLVLLLIFVVVLVVIHLVLSVFPVPNEIRLVIYLAALVVFLVYLLRGGLP